MTREDPNVHPLWAAETKALAQAIEKMDYFQILGVRPDAKPEDLKSQYHALQRTYHPDTFYQSPDLDLRQAVFRISKRIAEAYVILRDPERRRQYTRDIAGPERDRKLRFNDETEQEVRKEKEANLGRTPQARQLVQKAIMATSKGDLVSAERDLKMALLFEKTNEAIQKRLSEVQESLKSTKK